ncbi:MAG: hypothetical protein B7Z55_05980 [Planctomycetales bacterium 12-60-4]|nr:MAG: hypothetical protein B7Z55_05980 [Planctomycetales bacterium 12-60-4]
MCRMQARWSVSRAPYWLALVAGITTVSLPGCGGAPAPVSNETAAAPTKAKPAKTKSSESDDAEPSNPNVRVDADGRKWIGDIPWDVFFDDPLAVVANNTPVGGAPAAGTASMTPMESPFPETPASPSPSAAGGAVDWKSLVTMEQIADEAKRIRNHLTSSLQSQGSYNGNYKDLAVDGAVVSALAAVAGLHPGDISWKANSRFLREYGLQLNGAAVGLGRENYSASQTAAENIEAVLNGNLPGNAGDPPAARPFAEVASRAGLMNRMEKASEWMRANINAESVFNKELEQIRQESAILGLFAKIISDKTYDSTEEEDYVRPAGLLVAAAHEAVVSTEEKSYAKFQDAMNQIKKACDECHLSYRN